jgi:hypothetical protein
MWARVGAGVLVLGICGDARAQTIQLPSFSRVGVSTTVVVPDSGGAYVKRDRRAAAGLNRFNGLPRNRGWSIRRGAGSLGVTAQIHDPQAADAVLGGSIAGTARGKNLAQPLVIGAGQAAGGAPAGSVAELKQRRAQQALAANREALAMFEKGRRAQAAGKASVAAIYFRSAARQATGALHSRIEAELTALAATGGKQPNGATTARKPSTRTGRTDR